MKKLNFIYSLLGLASFTACSVVDPMSTEQYQKDIYIIGANEGVASYDVAFGNEVDAFVSISASGTQKVERDVNIKLKLDNEIIDKYNAKYMLDAPVKYRQLESNYMDISKWETTLKAGSIYTHFPFTVKTDELHCDSLYCIGFALESVSDYNMADEGTTLIYRLNLTNDFSGTYNLIASKYTLIKIGDEWTEPASGGVPVSIQRNLTATSADKVRFFHEKIKETLADYSNSWDPGKDYFNAINNYCLQFVRIGETNNFDIVAWGDFQIYEGFATYDAEDESFTFQYDYPEGANRLRMAGVLRK